MNNQKFIVSDIKDTNIKYKKLKRVDFKNGKYTEVYEKFQPSKIKKLQYDFANFVKQYEDNIGVLDSERVNKYLMLHVLLHFSTMFDEVPDDFAEKLDLFNQAIDNEYVETCFEELDKDEVIKVVDSFIKRANEQVALMEKETALKNEMLELIKDKKIKNKYPLLMQLMKQVEKNEQEDI